MGSACGSLGSISSSASRAGPSERGLDGLGTPRGLERRRRCRPPPAAAVRRRSRPPRRWRGWRRYSASACSTTVAASFLSLDPRVGARDAGQRGIALLGVGQGDVGLQRLGAFGDAIQRDQDLQHVAVGLARCGIRLLPGPCRLQRGVARARLERDFHGALVKRRVVGLARRIEHQRVARRRLGAPGVEFAQQQLVEKLGIQRRWRGAVRPAGDPACLGGAVWADLRAGHLGQGQHQGAGSTKGNRFIEP